MQQKLWDFKSEIVHVHVIKLQLTVFLVSFSIPDPISFLLVVTKLGSHFNKLPFKTTVNKEEIQGGNGTHVNKQEVNNIALA